MTIIDPEGQRQNKTIRLEKGTPKKPQKKKHTHTHTEGKGDAFLFNGLYFFPK